MLASTLAFALASAVLAQADAAPAKLTAPDPKPLNTLVTELLSVNVTESQGEWAFRNPRQGWIFLAAPPSSGPPRIRLDDEEDPLVLRRNPESGAWEAMRLLAEGVHQIRVVGAAAGGLVVHAVPELAYCYFPVTPHISAQGAYDWPFLERYVLAHVNVIVTAGAPDDIMAAWQREGRQWLSNAALPGLADAEAPRADAVLKAWAENPGATDPRFGGLIVDEFVHRAEPYYAAWMEAVQHLYAMPAFKGKTFYAWVTGIHSLEHGRAFCRSLSELGGRFAWESYLCEQPTEAENEEEIRKSLENGIKHWREAVPGIEQRMTLCLGYMSAPPESLDRQPGIDYNVFMDLQFHLLANSDVFDGLGGLMEYHSGYTDEEALRWAHRYIRHYAIEGRRERLNTAPLVLTHLVNPDFDDGLAGWNVEAAAPDSVKTDTMEKLGWLEGRYPETRAGDHFLVMKRSAERPNRASQRIQGLTPGRAYSLRFISAAIRELDRNQKLAFRAELSDAEIRQDGSFQFVFPSCYSHEAPPYTRDHPAYMNYHRVIFVPKTESILLTLTDWLAADAPGGPKGQETACNSAQETACDSAQETACDSAQETACNSVQETACNSVQETACNSVQETACNFVQETACNSVQEIACNFVQVQPYLLRESSER